MSENHGKKFDNPASKKDIKPFIAVRICCSFYLTIKLTSHAHKQYFQLNVNEIARDPDDFDTFNEFFFRKLKPEARPIASPDDPVRHSLFFNRKNS